MIRRMSVRRVFFGRILFFLCLAGLSAFLPLSAQNVSLPRISLKAELDSSRILIGDQIRYRMEATVPQGLKVVFPEIGDTLTRGVDVLEKYPADSMKLSRDEMQYRLECLITSFDSGFHFIPAQAVKIQRPDGVDTLYSTSLPLEVLTIPSDTSVVLYDIKMPYRASVSLVEILPYIGGLLLLALSLFLLLRRKKKKKEAAKGPVIPPEAAHIIAIRELEELEKQQLWQNGKIREFHTRISEILRTYVERRYRFPAMERTSAEILEALRIQTGVSSVSWEEIKQTLLLADLVKFAKTVPDREENPLSMTRAIRFVQDTILVDVPEEPGTVETEAERNDGTIDNPTEKELT